MQEKISNNHIISGLMDHLSGMLHNKAEKKKKIIQMLPTISYGDAVGNHTLALRDTLLSNGYPTEIYAVNIDNRLPVGIAKTVDMYKDSADYLIIYHLSTGDPLNRKLKDYKAKIVIVYHNVTPARFWSRFNHEAEKRSETGLIEAAELADVPILCMADSSFNKDDLIKLGYKCRIEVLPLVIRFSDYQKEPDDEIIAKYYGDGLTNIIFTGRIAPNKKIEDIIQSFYLYSKYVNPSSRLILVGAYDEKDTYYMLLKRYVRKLNLENVIFTGHIPFEQVLAYYTIADVFLCLSEHEGFCVPLVEAMYFKVPIIAYASTAIRETLGGGGLLLTDKSPELVSEAINYVIENKNFRDKLVTHGTNQLERFNETGIKQRFIQLIDEIR